MNHPLGFGYFRFFNVVQKVMESMFFLFRCLDPVFMFHFVFLGLPFKLVLWVLVKCIFYKTTNILGGLVCESLFLICIVIFGLLGVLFFCLFNWVNTNIWQVFLESEYPHLGGRFFFNYQFNCVFYEENKSNKT